MDQFIEQSAPYVIGVGLVGMLIVIGLLIYVLARLARSAALIEESVLHQRRGIELAEESLGQQRESIRVVVELHKRGIELAEEVVALLRETYLLLQAEADRPQGET